MSEVVSTIVSDETAERLKSFARSIGKNNSEEEFMRVLKCRKY